MINTKDVKKSFKQWLLEECIHTKRIVRAATSPGAVESMFPHLYDSRCSPKDSILYRTPALVYTEDEYSIPDYFEDNNYLKAVSELLEELKDEEESNEDILEEEEEEEEEYDENLDEENFDDEKHVHQTQEKKQSVLYIETGHLTLETQIILNQHLDDIYQMNTWQEQIDAVYDILRDQNVSFSKIGKCFNVNKGTIANHQKRRLNGRGCIGSPTILTYEEAQSLNEYIVQKYFERSPCTYIEAIRYVSDNFQKIIEYDTMRHIISNSHHLKSVTGIPMEVNRIECSEIEIDKHFETVEKLLEYVPAQFYYNADESGFQSWSDARKIKVIVPIEHNSNEISIPINRNEKRASLLGCICADGTTLPPCIVTPRVTIEEELLKNGYNKQKYYYAHNISGFMNSQIFTDWFADVFIPHVTAKRRYYRYEEEIVLQIDGFTGHQGDEFLELCTEWDIYPLFEPPNSSDQIQPLDLGIFGVQKNRGIADDKFKSNHSKQIARMLNSWHYATTPINVINAFKRAGIVHTDIINEYELIKMRVEKSCAVRVRHYCSEEEIKKEEGKRVKSIKIEKLY